MQEGRQEGIIEGQTALILRQVARRTGEIPPETKTRIRQLSLEQLEDLGEILLDFTSQEDLIAWLESASAWIYNNFCTPDTKSGFHTPFIL